MSYKESDMGIHAGVITTVGSSSAVGTAWASLAASVGVVRQVTGISGGASNIACNIDLIFGGAADVAGDNQLRFHSGSGIAVQEFFGDLGPVTSKSIAVKTQNGAGKKCYANLLYRLVQ